MNLSKDKDVIMAKLKVLKSIGHNLMHSYLSLMNSYDGDYIVSHLYQIAKKNNHPTIIIDVLNKRIEPTFFCVDVIKQSLIALESDFHRLLQSDKLTIDYIKSVKAEINFDLLNPKIGVTGHELERYACLIEIVDLNGKSHSTNVKEWWRSGISG